MIIFLQSVKDDINLYVKNKELNKPVIIGHSMGAFLAFWAASSEPAIFDKVIAVDGLPFLTAVMMPGATAESAKPMAINARNAIQSQTPEQTKASQRMFLQSMITSQERIEYVSNMAATADAKTQAQVIYEMYTTDLRDSVAAIKSPVLLLGSWIGFKDYGNTKEIANHSYKAQVATIKNCTVEISDTAKHFIFYDDPAWFLQQVDAFINFSQPK